MSATTFLIKKRNKLRDTQNDIERRQRTVYEPNTIFSNIHGVESGKIQITKINFREIVIGYQLTAGEQAQLKKLVIADRNRLLTKEGQEVFLALMKLSKKVRSKVMNVAMRDKVMIK